MDWSKNIPIMQVTLTTCKDWLFCKVAKVSKFRQKRAQPINFFVLKEVAFIEA